MKQTTEANDDLFEKLNTALERGNEKGGIRLIPNEMSDEMRRAFEKKARKYTKYKLTNMKRWKQVRIARTECRKKEHFWLALYPGIEKKGFWWKLFHGRREPQRKERSICRRCAVVVGISFKELAEQF